MKPKDCPDARLELMQAVRRIEQRWRDTPLIQFLGDEHALLARRQCGWMDQVLPEARLWWVSGEMTAVVTALAPQLPVTTFSPAITPDDAGLVFFEEPLEGMDARDPDHRFRCSAICWNLAPFTDTGRPGVGIGFFRQVDKPEIREHLPGGWLPAGTTTWAEGRSFDQPHGDETDLQQASNSEDRRRLYAMWLVATQKNLIAPEGHMTPQRPARKRSERAGVSSDVRVVYLRRELGAGAPETTGPGSRTYENRWIVQPHLRQQPYGPGRTLTKLIVVPPHIKGPEGAPLLDPKRRVTAIVQPRKARAGGGGGDSGP